jgi:hypothetical protein
MRRAHTLAQAPPEPRPDSAPEAEAARPDHWSKPRMMRQLDRLERLAEIGMAMAETLAAQEAPDALAFDRVARAVRLTGALESLLIAQIDARDDGREIAGPQAAGAKGCANDDDDAVQDGEVLRLRWLDPVAERDNDRRDRGDRERIDRDPFADLLQLPVAEVIAHICRDLGLDSDAVRRELDSGRTDIALARLLAQPPPPDTQSGPQSGPPPDSPRWPDTA